MDTNKLIEAAQEAVKAAGCRHEWVTVRLKVDRVDNRFTRRVRDCVKCGVRMYDSVKDGD